MANEPEVIRQEMAQTRNALTGKLEALEQHVMCTVETATSAVNETVSNVKDAVEGTVCTVKESIGETVDTVRETFDVELQTRRHPWALVGAAVGAGFVGGIAMSRLSAAAPTTPSARAQERRAFPEAPPPRTAPKPSQTGPSLLQSFEPELEKAKAMALGAVFNVVKGLIEPHVPRNVKPQFAELMDNVTRKVGGNPVAGSILDEWK